MRSLSMSAKRRATNKVPARMGRPTTMTSVPNPADSPVTMTTKLAVASGKPSTV
jgi:hypothetical protein